MANHETWNRDELYREVWSTPMKTLATKYGISDVGLAKVCCKLLVPVPGRGYWAKKEAGQNLKQPPLPPLKENTVLYKPTPSPPPPKLSDFAAPEEMAIVERLERASEELELKRGSLSHLLILQARAAFKEANATEYGILWTHDACLDIRVSRDQLDRAFRIMAGLINLIEDAGFSVAVLKHDRSSHTVATMYGEQIRFGLVERIDRVDIVAPPQGGMLERVLKHGGAPANKVPSGKLSITVWTDYGSDRKRWSDGRLLLESQLSQVVAGFMRMALKDRADTRKRAAEEQERQRRAEEWAKLEAAVKAERSRVHALEDAAAKWAQAEQVRSFISAAQAAAALHGQSADPGTQFGDWIIWAQQQADRIDPLKESPPSIIDRIEEPDPDPPSSYGYGYQKPERRFRFQKPIWRLK